MPFVYVEYDPNVKDEKITVRIHDDMKLKVPREPPKNRLENGQGAWIKIDSNVDTALKDEAFVKKVKDQFKISQDITFDIKADLKQRLFSRGLKETFQKAIELNTTENKKLYVLRKGIIEFADQLFSQMHKYCDPITEEMKRTQDTSIGALYGAFNVPGSKLWNEMMNSGPIAGFMAKRMLSLLEANVKWETELRGKSLKDDEKFPFSRPENLEDEVAKCASALSEVENSLVALFNGLDLDSNNEKRKGSDDQARQTMFKNWAIEQLATLYHLTNEANKSLQNGLQNIDLDKFPKDVQEKVKEAVKTIKNEELESRLAPNLDRASEGLTSNKPH